MSQMRVRSCCALRRGWRKFLIDLCCGKFSVKTPCTPLKNWNKDNHGQSPWLSQQGNSNGPVPDAWAKLALGGPINSLFRRGIQTSPQILCFWFLNPTYLQITTKYL